MKNENISPGEEVPVEIRIEIYKEAIKLIETGEPIAELSTFCLCLTLPCILWELDSFLSVAPNGEPYDSNDAPNMFPELTPERIYSIETYPDNFGRNDQRLKVLNNMLIETESK